MIDVPTAFAMRCAVERVEASEVTERSRSDGAATTTMLLASRSWEIPASVAAGPVIAGLFARSAYFTLRTASLRIGPLSLAWAMAFGWSMISCALPEYTGAWLRAIAAPPAAARTPRMRANTRLRSENVLMASHMVQGLGPAASGLLSHSSRPKSGVSTSPRRVGGISSAIPRVDGSSSGRLAILVSVSISSRWAKRKYDGNRQCTFSPVHIAPNGQLSWERPDDGESPEAAGAPFHQELAAAFGAGRLRPGGEEDRSGARRGPRKRREPG